MTVLLRENNLSVCHSKSYMPQRISQQLVAMTGQLPAQLSSHEYPHHNDQNNHVHHAGFKSPSQTPPDFCHLPTQTLPSDHAPYRTLSIWNCQDTRNSVSGRSAASLSCVASPLPQLVCEVPSVVSRHGSWMGV